MRAWVAAGAALLLGVGLGATGSALASTDHAPTVERLDQIIALAEAAKADLTTPEPTATPTAEGRQAVIDAAGPRVPAVETITSAAAKQRIVDTGLLESVAVTGGLDLSSVTRPYTIRDVSIDAAGAPYGIRTRIGFSGVTPPDGPQVIEHCSVVGASSAGIYAQDATVVGCDVSESVDAAKLGSRVVFERNWTHDHWYRTGAHMDSIQMQYGVDTLIRGNVLDAFVGARSDDPARVGTPANAALQTGSMLGDLKAQFVGNWVDGGGYTIRMGTSGPPTIDWQFRGNRFGRGFAYGPTSGTRDHPTTYGGVRFDGSNVWDDTGAPVT